jgi:hypothetical protein
MATHTTEVRISAGQMTKMRDQSSPPDTAKYRCSAPFRAISAPIFAN